MKNTVLFIVSLSFAFVLQAQCYEETVRKADSAYFKLELKKAKALYEQALECPDAGDHNYGLSAINGVRKCKEKLGATVVVNTKVIVEKCTLQDVKDSDNDDSELLIPDEEPCFPGGWDAYYKYLKDNLKYPDLARDNNIEGRVVARYVIEKDGSVTGVTLLREIGAGCGDEVLRVLNSMPKWKPGKRNGKPIRREFTQPVQFILY